MRSPITVLSLVLCAVAPFACGGSVDDHNQPPDQHPDASTPDAPVSEDGSTPDAPHVPPPGETPPQHRPTAAACSATTVPGIDGGGAACKTDADCTSSVGGLSHCLNGTCGLDQCLTDSDCGSSSVCACASDYYGGNGVHGNICVPGNCRVDSDCGAGGFCIPSQGYCGAFQGYYCHTPSDTCVDPKLDCSGLNESCVYDQTVGHFACATVTCAG
jgi:hypothetical protein